MNQFDFSEALRRLKLGAKLYRISWQPKTYLQIVGNKITLFIGTDYKFILPNIDIHDILGMDWVDQTENLT